MVERYWGRAAASPSDYEHLVRPVEAGIPTDVLAEAVRSRGWRAERVEPRLEAVASHVAEGRPVVLLMQVAPDRYHYVVVVAVTGDAVLLHDPARAPYRRLPREELLRRWEEARRWGLVVVPGTEPGGGPGPPVEERTERAADPDAAAPPAACAEPVREGVAAARAGRHARADSLLRAAARRCPEAAAPRRELAGLRFRQERWSEAANLAERALELAPRDEHAVRLLGASRWLSGDRDGALRAWNRIDEPRLTSLRVYGLRRTGYEALRRQIGLPGGGLLTPGRLEAARRRVASVPALGASRVDLRAPGGGGAELEVAVLEPAPWPLPSSLAVLGARALRAGVRREITLEAASPVGRGERWRAGWRWWAGRPRVAVRLDAPGAFGVPGVWSVGGSWERESFGLRSSPGAPAADGADDGRSVVREERTRVRLGLSRWVTGDLRLEARAGRDDWKALGSRAVLGAGAGLRGAEDRWALLARVAGWIGEGTDFASGRLDVAVRSAPDASLAVSGRAGVRGVSAGAPRTEWPGAGTGRARSALLRADPLLADGTIVGRAFGRRLAHATVEASTGLPALGPLAPRLAVFGDLARPWRTGRVGEPALHAAVGVGVSLDVPGLDGSLRLEYGRGLRDGEDALTLRWAPPWPGW